MLLITKIFGKQFKIDFQMNAHEPYSIVNPARAGEISKYSS